MDFDTELAARIKNKKAGEDIEPMVNSESYRKLYVMKLLTYRMREKLAYFYSRLIENSSSERSSVQDREKSQQFLANFLSSLHDFWSKNQTSRLAMADLFQELVEVQDSYRSADRSLHFNETIEKGLKFIESNQDPQRFYTTFNQSRSLLNRIAIDEAQRADPEFQEELKKTVFVNNKVFRQSTLMASTGSEGNTNGSDFPRGSWALTYDDGPHATYTPKILDMLKANGIKATFFWLAKLAPSYPAIVQRAQNEGHHLAVHSYSHSDLSKRSTDRNQEVTVATEIMEKSYGVSPQFFRCPYGSCIFNGKTEGSKEARRLISEKKMIHVLWNVDSNDWKSDTPDVIFKRTRDQINNLSRGIVLFHDIHERSFTASQKLVTETLKDKRMVKMDDVVREINGF